MPESDVTKMKVADLKRELKLRGLTVNGNKTELQDRLQTALLEGDISLEDSAIADAIDDDDVSLTDEDEHKLLGDDELLKSPVSTPTTVAIPDLLAEDKSTTDSTTALPAKKIVLKRNNSQQSTGAAASTATTPSKENEAPTTAITVSTDETPTKKHKPIIVGPKTEGDKPAGDKKLTQLTAQERLELRAKKFGITPAASTAVAATATTVAAAINKSSSASITANKGNKETEEQQKEALKRRAERFGCVVPEKTPKSAAEERLLKRKERFGAGAATTEATPTAATTESKDAWSEKARARLERFKTVPAAEATK
ncbi:uncharacterized protein LOC108092092 [Drosophila ficusphila]|uniref:uncharacterized protein LOC108092092 n=1 Tax=Drosophila ficusphila TaxID=30025 RepID=UPI0007E65F5F|nr:uncharacterized protein LOC108092092 [Drosophila ficusphila]